MNFRKVGLAIGGVCLTLFGHALPVLAQDYPSRPVRMVVGFPPGGPTDVLARFLGQKVADGIGQPVIVENRPGASVTIAANQVAKAAPDGYTLFFTPSAHAGNATLYSKLPYDTLKDFAPIVALASTPVVIIVSGSSKYRSMKDFLSDVRARPGKLNYGAAGGGGGTTNIAFEMFKSQLKLDVVSVNYKGSAQSMPAVMSGEVDISFDTIGSSMGPIRAGNIRALAVTSPKRASVLPDVPTLTEDTIPGFDVVGWFGVLAPAGTPQNVIQLLNREFVQVLSLQDMRERMLSLGLEPLGGTPVEFGRMIETDVVRYGEVIRRLGLKAD